MMTKYVVFKQMVCLPNQICLCTNISL